MCLFALLMQCLFATHSQCLYARHKLTLENNAVSVWLNAVLLSVNSVTYSPQALASLPSFPLNFLWRCVHEVKHISPQAAVGSQHNAI